MTDALDKMDEATAFVVGPVDTDPMVEGPTIREYDLPEVVLQAMIERVRLLEYHLKMNRERMDMLSQELSPLALTVITHEAEVASITQYLKEHEVDA